MNDIFEDQSKRQTIYEQKPTVGHRTRKILWGTPLIAILLIGSIIGSGVLISRMYDAHQIGNIDVTANEQNDDLMLLDYYSDAWHGLGNMKNLEIPLLYTDLQAGQNVSMTCRICNPNAYDAYAVVNITEDWFNDESSPLYGFRFGVIDGGNDMNGVPFAIPASTNKEFTLWYSVDDDMVTPPNGTAPVNIQVQAWVT